MPDQRIAPPTRRGPGAPGRPKPACSPAYAPTGIGSSRKATYHSSMPTGPLVVLVPGVGDLRRPRHGSLRRHGEQPCLGPASVKLG
jgi:hypothetical protein